MEKQRIGLIGIGMMGHGIAANIARGGWPLSYLHHPGNQDTADLDAAGARRLDDVRALAAECEVVILCVTGSTEVETIMSADGGLVGALKPGSIVVDCSTGIPSITQRLARDVEAAGGRFVDAAMTRTPREAAEGRLNLLIGGDAATVEELTPLLASFSENRFHAGPVGAGQTLKLLHNFVSLGSVTLLAEAAACAAANGISPQVFVDCLGRGGGGGAALDRVSPYILEGESSQLRFTAANARKDLRYYQALVAETGTRSDVAAGVLSALEWLNDAGLGDRMLPEACDAFGRADLTRNGEPG